MNTSATKLLVGISLLASIAVVACDDSDEPHDELGQANNASAHADTAGSPSSSSSTSSGSETASTATTPGSSGAMGSTSSTSGSVSAPGDAGTPLPPPANDAGSIPPARTLALHCTGPSAPSGPVICLENAEGHAGDVVDIEVHLVRPDSCGTADYATATFDVDPARFELANPDDQPSCLQRSTSPSFSDPALNAVVWQAFGKSSAPAGCTASAGVGKVDTLELRIKPGTPAGDYEMKVVTSELLGGGPACTGVFLDVSGTVRVLP